MDANTDIDQTTLADVIMEQTWCLNAEKTSIHNKVLVTTAKAHLETARTWLNIMLPNHYHQYVADKLDVTTIKWMMPRRLDKLTVTAASTAYADKLKQQTAGHKEDNATQALITKPPWHNKFQPVDVTFNESNFPPLKETKPKTTPTQQQKMTMTATQNATTTAP